MRWLLNIRNKHLAPERLSEYLDGRLTGRALQRAEAHLIACAACRQEMESLRATVALLRRTPQVAPRRSFVLMQPPVSAPLPRRPRRVLAPGWAFSAAATVLVAIFVAVLSLDMGGALAPVSPVPVPSPTSRVLDGPASTPTPVPAPSPIRALEAQVPTPTSVPGGFGMAAVSSPTPSPAPPQFAAPQPTPAPGGELLAGAAEKAAAKAPEALDTATTVPPPLEAHQDDAAFEAVAAPEATSVQAVVQGPTPWAWRLAEGLLAAGALLVGGLGLWRWGRDWRAAR